MLTKIWNKWNSHTLLVVMQIGTATLEKFAQTHRYREDLTTAKSRGVEGKSETGKGIKSTNW